MGRTILLDAKPLSNLLARVSMGHVLDPDQAYFPTTYERLASFLSEGESRLLSTQAVAAEALHYLLEGPSGSVKMTAIRTSPIALRPGVPSDLNDYGQANLRGIDFADFTLIRAWDSLAQSGIRPYPVTVTTDWPLCGLARGRYQQNAYTVEELEGQPDLL